MLDFYNIHLILIHHRGALPTYSPTTHFCHQKCLSNPIGHVPSVQSSGIKLTTIKIFHLLRIHQVSMSAIYLSQFLSSNNPVQNCHCAPYTDED